MRKFDKKNKMVSANIMAEKRYLESKGFINENVFHAEGGINVFSESSNAKFDLNSNDNEFSRELSKLINRYVGLSNTNDAGMSTDNRVFIHKNLMKIVNQTFPTTSLRVGVDGKEYYTNRPEEMGEFLTSMGITDFRLKGVNESHYGSEEGESYGSSIDRVNYSPEKGNTLTQFMDELIAKGLTGVSFVKVDGNKMIFSTDTPIENEIVVGLGRHYDVKSIDGGNGKTLLVFNMV